MGTGNDPAGRAVGDGVAGKQATAAAESVAERRARFERATAPHLDALLRVALRMTGGLDRAEDAVQECYLRAWKYFDSFEAGKDPKVWLFAILRNAIFEAGRKRKREPRAASLDEIGAESAAAAPRATGPVERLGEREVLEAIERLPEEFRVVAVLAIVEGLKYREIAEAVDIPVGTVMSRLFRARQLLRYHLRGYVGGEADMEEVA
jgi:RNA polymerase sigma-70 factor (ECF subfamily)